MYFIIIIGFFHRHSPELHESICRYRGSLEPEFLFCLGGIVMIVDHQHCDIAFGKVRRYPHPVEHVAQCPRGPEQEIRDSHKQRMPAESPGCIREQFPVAVVPARYQIVLPVAAPAVCEHHSPGSLLDINDILSALRTEHHRRLPDHIEKPVGAFGRTVAPGHESRIDYHDVYPVPVRQYHLFRLGLADGIVRRCKRIHHRLAFGVSISYGIRRAYVQKSFESVCNSGLHEIFRGDDIHFPEFPIVIFALRSHGRHMNDSGTSVHQPAHGLNILEVTFRQFQIFSSRTMVTAQIPDGADNFVPVLEEFPDYI